jgi:hypothetical protein
MEEEKVEEEVALNSSHDFIRNTITYHPSKRA